MRSFHLSQSSALKLFDSSVPIQPTSAPEPSMEQIFRFLDLSPELRVIIYNFLIPEKITIPYGGHLRSCQATRRGPWYIWPPGKLGKINFNMPYQMLLANHQVSSEFQHELAKREFVFETPRQYIGTAHALPAWLTSAMKDVRLETPCDHCTPARSRGRQVPLLNQSCQEHTHSNCGLSHPEISLECGSRSSWERLHLDSLTFVLEEQIDHTFWSPVTVLLDADYQLPPELPSMLYEMVHAGKLHKLHVKIRRGSLEFVNYVLIILYLPTARKFGFEDDLTWGEKTAASDSLNLLYRLSLEHFR